MHFTPCFCKGTCTRLKKLCLYSKQLGKSFCVTMKKHVEHQATVWSQDQRVRGLSIFANQSSLRAYVLLRPSQYVQQSQLKQQTKEHKVSYSKFNEHCSCICLRAPAAAALFAFGFASLLYPAIVCTFFRSTLTDLRPHDNTYNLCR